MCNDGRYRQKQCDRIVYICECLILDDNLQNRTRSCMSCFHLVIL